MPTYEYRCNACEHEWDEFQPMSAKATRKCPKCRKLKAERLISAGGGLIFRGSGFYLTDYRSESYKKGADAAKKVESNISSAASSGDSGSASGGDKAKTSSSEKSD